MQPMAEGYLIKLEVIYLYILYCFHEYCLLCHLVQLILILNNLQPLPLLFWAKIQTFCDIHAPSSAEPGGQVSEHLAQICWCPIASHNPTTN